jgi:hypothetical protein
MFFDSTLSGPSNANVSEEHFASIFKVEEYSKQEASLIAVLSTVTLIPYAAAYLSVGSASL